MSDERLAQDQGGREELMRVLIARFHPMSKAQPDAVIVGRVICRDGRAEVEPADLRSVRPFDSERLIEKLTFLVAAVGQDAERLLTLRSQFWSFVRAPGVESDVPKGRPVR